MSAAERICELCGKSIEESESYFMNRDGGDLHLACWNTDSMRLILRRGFVVHPKAGKTKAIRTPWDKGDVLV